MGEFVDDYCLWIKSDPQTHVNEKMLHDPQPLDRLVSGLSLAIDCLSCLPQCVSSASENHGASPVEMYEKVLDFLLLDSRPGMPIIHMLHALDGAMNVSSDVFSFLPSTQIALTLQPSFVRVLVKGFVVCSLQSPVPSILHLEERTWFILMGSFQSCSMFLSGLSSDSLINVASEIAWVAAARALLQCVEFWRSGNAMCHWQPGPDAPDLCRIVDLCLECFTLPMNMCGNDCITVAMDLLASVLPLCPCSHCRVSLEMSSFRRFASLLLGSTTRATISVKSSALKLLGVCFELGLQPHDLDEFLSSSRSSAPELRFSPSGHSFGGGPLLSLNGIEFSAVDIMMKALNSPASSKMVPWFVAPFTPTAAVAQICRSTMLFGKDLERKQVMFNIRSSKDVYFETLFPEKLLKDFVDCADTGKYEKFKEHFFSGTSISYLPKEGTGSDLHERTAVIESSFWLHGLTTALVHLKSMLSLFSSFLSKKESAFADVPPMPQHEAMFYPWLATSLNNRVVAPLLVQPSRFGKFDLSAHCLVSNPLCVPVFLQSDATKSATKIQPNSESEVYFTKRNGNSYNTFLSILQVLMNGRLKLVQQIFSEKKHVDFIDVSDPRYTTSLHEWNDFCGNLLKTLCTTSVVSSHPADGIKREQTEHVRFCTERLLFLSDFSRLCMVDETANNSPESISFVVRVATSLAAIPSRQSSEIIFAEPLPPLIGSFWPLVIALFIPGNLRNLKNNEAVHRLVDHFAEPFSGMCLELTGLSYKIASNFLDDHPSFPISDVLSHLDVQHALPSQYRRQNFRALDFPRCFLGHLSQFLSASGFCSDPGSMQRKKQQDITTQYFISFFSVHTKIHGICGIPSELLQQFVLNEGVIQTLCVNNFRAQFGKVLMLHLPDLHPSSGKMAGTHPFPSDKCSFDEHWYVLLKKHIFHLNLQNTSLVTSLYMLDFIRSFYSATSRRSKFLSMGFSSFYPQPEELANEIYNEYEPQHSFIQTVVSIISSLGCMTFNRESADSCAPGSVRENAFVKKIFEFICSSVEDKFVVDCVNPAALRSLQLELCEEKSRLQDMEFRALQKRSCWGKESFKPPSQAYSYHGIERTFFHFSSTSRMKAVHFQNLVPSDVDPVWKKGDMCMVQYDGKFYPSQVTNKEEQTSKFEVSFTDYENSSHQCTSNDMKKFGGLADVLVDLKWKREIHVSSFVQLFDSNSECAMLNQDKNTFLKKCFLGSQNPYLFDNQDLFLLKSAFREDFRVSGAKHEVINGVYELCTFSGSAENSRYRMNPALFGPSGSHYCSIASYSKVQKPGSLDFPDLYYENNRWVIHYGGKVMAYLVAEMADKTPQLKHCISSSNWKEDELPSNIRVELLTNTCCNTVSSIRRSCLIRLVHKSNFVVQFKNLYQDWKNSVNLVLESLCLYSKSPIFFEHSDCALPSFLGCFSSMISLLPRDRAAIYSPPLRSICLVLVQYLRGANPDDPNTLLTSSQLTAVGVILSTLSLASGCVCCRLFCFCLIYLSLYRSSRSF